MTDYRRKKVESLANIIPELEIFGAKSGKLLVLGWGSTYGAISTAVEKEQKNGTDVSSAHLKYLNPFPNNLGKVLSSFENILIPELNMGQLSMIINSKFNLNVIQLNKVQGKPFLIHEITEKIRLILEGK